jgi:rubrerythrin
MDWNTPKGILRKGMSLERDGYNFYMQVAEHASDKRGKAMFLDLAQQEKDHLHLLWAEYNALEAGKGWLPYEQAMQVDMDFDPSSPNLPGQEPPGPPAVFTPDRMISVENDVAALKFGLETERISRQLYADGAEKTDDANARAAYKFLVEQEEKHYELLQNTHDYLVKNETWWDSEEYPFFIG